jgi:hypothetical protein
LKTNELDKFLVVAQCVEMWLRMHGVPPISPSGKTRRLSLSSQTRFGLYDANFSVLCGIQFFALSHHRSGHPAKAFVFCSPMVIQSKLGTRCVSPPGSLMQLRNSLTT